MKISIKRDSKFREYNIPIDNITLLEALNYIKINIDSTLSWRSSCKSGVCGSCAMRVNNKEILACSYKVKNLDKIEPLRYARIIKDLVIDLDNSFSQLKIAKTFLNKNSNNKVLEDDEKKYSLQTDCILCNSCYSSCPVLEVNKIFIGPFALTRNYRYVSDNRNEEIKIQIDDIQENGIWDCTQCGECVFVCPQNINPKMDIMMLRTKSFQFGFTDPNMANFNSGINFSFTPSF